MSSAQTILDVLAGIHNFGDGAGPVPAHRHTNPDGTLGGWIADSVDQQEVITLWLTANASIGGEVTLMGDVRVLDNAIITGISHLRNATIKGNAQLSHRVIVGYRHGEMGRVLIKDNALITGNNIIINGHTVIGGSAHIAGNGTEIRDAIVGENAHIFGGCVYQSIVKGNATIQDSANVSGGAVIQGDVTVMENAKVYGNYIVQGNVFLHKEQFLRGGEGIFDDEAWGRWLAQQR